MQRGEADALGCHAYSGEQGVSDNSRDHRFALGLQGESKVLEDYQELREEIESVTKFKLAIEGIYKWIVFLPSKVDPQNQVPNRYFGCFEKNNELKVRGIEWRRHDAPIYFKKCQEEILNELAEMRSSRRAEDLCEEGRHSDF